MATTTTTITPDMTVQALIDAGLTLPQLQRMVNAAAQGATISATGSRQEFAEEVYAILIERPTAEWKNGEVLKTWFPNGKEQDAELEKARVKRHQEISRALSDLVSDGRLVKERKGSSASGTFYKVVEAKMPQPEDAADVDGDEA